MNDHNSQNNYEAQTLILNDSNGNEIFCYLEQIVNVEEKEEDVQRLKKIQLDLKNKHNGRLLVRPSGTEPIVRILVECEYNDKIDQYISKVQNLLVKENSSE